MALYPLDHMYVYVEVSGVVWYEGICVDVSPLSVSVFARKGGTSQKQFF
jgi:hypothetical protein